MEHISKAADDLFDAPIVRSPMFDGSIDGSQYINNIVEPLAESEAIVAFDNIFLLEVCGSSPEFRKTLLSKIDEGTPFFIQSMRRWESYFNPFGGANDDDKKFPRDFFRHIGVVPTPIKVFSKDMHEGDWSGAQSWFRAGDGCFLNADLLGGVSKILISRANLLSYDTDCFPAVEIGPLHELVDDGDYFVDRPIGERLVVAVERRSKNQKGLVLSGNLALDRRQLVGGWESGFEENEDMVYAILRYLANNANTAQRRSQRAYIAFDQLERTLSKLVHTCLGADKDRAMLLPYLSIEAKNKLIARAGKPDTSRLDLSDLMTLMWKNWEQFRDCFAPASKKSIRKPMEGFNQGLRRYIAHPHLAQEEGYKFPESDIEKMEQVLPKVNRALKNAKNL